MANRSSGYDGLNDVGPVLFGVAAVIGLVLIVLGMGGCGTIAGFGSDLQALGNGTKAAMSAKEK